MCVCVCVWKIESVCVYLCVFVSLVAVAQCFQGVKGGCLGGKEESYQEVNQPGKVSWGGGVDVLL